MSELELECGPSAFSTLFFIPEFMKELMDDQDNATSEKQTNSNKKKNNNNNGNITSDDDMESIYDNLDNYIPPSTRQLRSQSNQDLLKRSLVSSSSSFSDWETMVFVGLRDIIKINEKELAKLYNYNKMQYQTFNATVNNKLVDYANLLNQSEFRILYHFFGDIDGEAHWNEVSQDLGFSQLYSTMHINELFYNIRHIEIRANGKHEQLTFFMKLIIFYWDNIYKIGKNFQFFWLNVLNRTIKFISEFHNGSNIEVYCLKSCEWTNATINNVNIIRQTVDMTYLDGTSGSLSLYSPRLAPQQFRYKYIPNTRNSKNKPSIIVQIDKKLHDIAPKSITERLHFNHTIFKPPPQKKARTSANNPPNTLIMSHNINDLSIPLSGWQYQIHYCGIYSFFGPVSISDVFIACAEQLIDQFTPIKHPKYGITKLILLPHIIHEFQLHVQRCKQQHKLMRDIQTNNDIQLTPVSTILSSNSHIPQQTPQLSIFTQSSRSGSTISNTLNHNQGDGFFINNNHNNSNFVIPENSKYM